MTLMPPGSFIIEEPNFAAWEGEGHHQTAVTLQLWPLGLAVRDVSDQTAADDTKCQEMSWEERWHPESEYVPVSFQQAVSFFKAGYIQVISQDADIMDDRRHNTYFHLLLRRSCRCPYSSSCDVAVQSLTATQLKHILANNQQVWDGQWPSIHNLTSRRRRVVLHPLVTCLKSDPIIVKAHCTESLKVSPGILQKT